MNIVGNNSYNNTNFKSLNHPIKPFTIKTMGDEIKFKEIDYTRKTYKSKFLKEIGSFFLDNFANQSSHPFWKQCRKGTADFNKNTYGDYLKTCMTDIYKQDFKNPDTTVLLGRNKHKKLTAAIITTPLNLSPITKDSETLYVDSLAVNKKYRGKHIAETLLNKVIDSSKNDFSDSFLVAYNESMPFYEKQGFKHLDEASPQQRVIIKDLAKQRIDYPQYASFVNKPLDETKTRWYDKFTKQLKFL